MAYPTIVSVRDYGSGADASPKLVLMPGVINTGDLLTMCFDLNGTFNLTIDTPTSWVNYGSQGNSDTSKLFMKRADGTEDGTTVSVSHSDFAGTQIACAQTLRITGWIEQDPVAGNVVSTGGVLNSDTLNLTGVPFTPGWGPGVETLWVSYLIVAGNQSLVTSPTGWSRYRSTQQGGTMRIHSAYYNSTDETLAIDSVVWTVSASTSLLGYLFAVRGPAPTPEGDLVVYADSPSMVIHQEVSIY